MLLLFCDIVILKVFCDNVSMRREEINITKRELQKLMIIQKTIERKLTVREAGQALDLSQQGG